MRHFLITAILLFTAGALHAGTPDDAARQFLQARAARLGDRVTVTVHPATAPLGACARPEPFLPGNGQRLLGRVTVGIRCGDGRVRYLQARVAAHGTYWVAARRIPAGSRIDRSMLEAREGDLGHLPHAAILDPGQAVGRATTRTLAEGSIVQSTQLRAPHLVQSNHPVTVEASGPGFRVTRQGRALQDGAMGESVRVRMPDRSVLTGVVAGDGRVAVDY